MSILKKYTKHFNPERYKTPFFKSSKIQNKIKKDGYCVINLLSKKEIDQLMLGFEQLKQSVSGDFGEQFWPSGRCPDPTIRKLAKSKIEEVVPARLKEILVKDCFDFIGGTYLIKPPSAHSALNPHQDSSHVDEFKHFSIYAWIPLQDVSKKNGAVRVLPKSHYIDIKQRSLNVPWVFKEHTDLLNEYMIDIPMQAGQVLLFDAGLIHSSPPNMSENTRVAVNFYIHNNSCPFTHFYEDDETPKGMVELFEVTPDFYYSENFEEKPSSRYPFIGTQAKPFLEITSSELRRLLIQLKRRSGILCQLIEIFIR